jgi:hypothetical protein
MIHDLRRIVCVLGRAAPTSNSGYVCSCPVPSHGKGRGDKNPSLSIAFSSNGDLLVHCHAGCDRRDVLSELRRRGLIEARQGSSKCGVVYAAAARVKASPALFQGDDNAKRALASAARIASQIIPLFGTPGATYLRDIRKIDLDAIEDVLAWDGRYRLASRRLFQSARPSPASAQARLHRWHHD